MFTCSYARTLNKSDLIFHHSHSITTEVDLDDKNNIIVFDKSINYYQHRRYKFYDHVCISKLCTWILYNLHGNVLCIVPARSFSFPWTWYGPSILSSKDFKLSKCVQLVGTISNRYLERFISRLPTHIFLISADFIFSFILSSRSTIKKMLNRIREPCLALFFILRYFEFTI